MENLLLSLKSMIATWLSSSFSPWVIDIIFGIMCGLVLFLIVLHFVNKPPLPPPPRKHRNIKKRPVKQKRHSRMKSGASKGELLPLSPEPQPSPPVLSPRAQLQVSEDASGRALRESPAHRDCLQDLEEARGMVSLLQSRLGRLLDKGSLHHGSCQDSPGEVCKAAPEGAHRPCGGPVEDAAPTMSPLASSPPPTQHPPPLTSAPTPNPTTSSNSVRSHSSLSALQPQKPSPPLDSLSPQPVTLSPPTLCPPDSEEPPPHLTASSAPPQPDSTLTPPQCDSMALPLVIVPQNSSPHTPWMASLVPVPATSGRGHSSCHISALSWWQVAAKALCLSTSSQCESQREHLSHRPAEALFWEDPTDRQVEAGRPSLLNSDDPNLLQIQVTETINIKICKEKEKDRSHQKQMSPQCNLNSLGNMMKSLDAEQDAKPPQHSRSTKGKPEHLPGTQQLSYPKVLEDHLQQKYNQHFWGLPALHSESLVATAWISENSSAPQSPSSLFNGMTNAGPIQTQATVSPPLSHCQPLSHLEFQSQSLVPTLLCFQTPSPAQVQTQKHLQSSLPILPPSSPPQIGACGASYPTAQDKPQSLIPVEIQHPESSLLQKQLERGQASSSVVKRPQEVFSSFTSNLPKDSWEVSILPENFPISPELQKQLEQHLQGWLVQHRGELPHKIPLLLERGQLRGELPGTCEAQGKHGTSWPSSVTGESSKDAQEVGFQLSQDMGKGLGHIPGKVPKDVSRASESSLVTFQGVDSEESESDLMPLRSDSGSELLRSLDKNLENILKGHLGKKLVQIREGFIPLTVRRSWLATNYAFAKSDTDVDTRNLGILKGSEPRVNTTHRVSFLNTNTQQVLEAHITRLWVRHRWCLPLKVLKATNLFKLKKAQPLPIQQFTFPLSDTCVSGAHLIAKFAELPGKPPQANPGEVITEESGPNLVRPLLAPSPVCEEIQKAPGGTPSGDDHGPIKASLTTQEGRPPSQSLKLTRQSGTVVWAQRGSLPPSSSSAMAQNQPRGKSGGQASGDPCHQVKMLEMNVGSQSLRVKEARGAMEAKLSPALLPESRVTLGTNVLTKSQNSHVRSLEAPGTSKSPPFPRRSFLQGPGEPCLYSKVISEFKAKAKAQSENQPQDCPTHKLLAADSVASQLPQCHPQRVPPGDRVASQVAAQRSSLGQQEPRISKLQDSRKNQSNMTAPTYKREDCRGPNPGEHAEGLEEVGASQAGTISPSAQTKGPVECPLLPEKQGPPESSFTKRMRPFFQWILPKKKLEGQDARQKHKPISATYQCQNPGKSRPDPHSETAVAQALMTAVGQILEDKMAIHRRHLATNLNEPKQGLQAPVCGCFCHHSLPLDPEHGRMMSHTACSHQANASDQSCSIREHRQSLKSVRFDNEQPVLSRFLSVTTKNAWSPVSPCHHGPRMPGALGLHQHCPEQCLLRGGVLRGQP